MPRVLRWFVRGVAAAAGVLVLLGVGDRLRHPTAAPSIPEETCFLTGGDSLRVCHRSADEGVFYTPSDTQLAYNTQIVALPGGDFVTVLHSEAEEQAGYHARTGRLRPGDSIKTGRVRAGSGASPYAAPADLAFRIWGSLRNPRSPLFYRYDNPNSPASGLSGGANPMVVAGRRDAGDPYSYVFFLGVTSDDGQGSGWRNVLLQARTRDFTAFDLLEAGGRWQPFGAETSLPTVVKDVAGQPIESSHPAPVEKGDKENRPRGSVITAGVFGSVVRVNGVYHYFYTDQDPADRARNHLYLRTAEDISADGRWSAARPVLDLPPEMLIRVAKARNMDRWVLAYNCLRTTQPVTFDVCVQYTSSLAVDGADGIGGLRLFDGAVFNGFSTHALGLVGGDRAARTSLIRGQQFFMTDEDGNLAVPRPDDPSRATVGGLLTWMDLPRDFAIFGAPTYWAEWSVTPALTSAAAPPR